MVTATELRELQAAEKELEPVLGEVSVDFRTRLDYLRLVRKLQLRRSALVAQAGLPLLNDPASRRKLGEEGTFLMPGLIFFLNPVAKWLSNSVPRCAFMMGLSHLVPAFIS